jgi:AcrR family transcriptional regulator
MSNWADMKRRGKKRAETKEETRAALIEAGMALFAKYGLDEPSLDDICAKAGFTRGAFYVHFADRDAFLVAVMDDIGRRIVDQLLVAGSGGIAEAVERFVAASASGEYPLMPAGGIRWHQLVQACMRSHALRERYLGLVDMSAARIGGLVAQGQRAGLVRDEIQPPHAGMLLIALIVGLQTLADLGAPVDLRSLAPDVVALLSPAHR